jgi:hypothetical protein
MSYNYTVLYITPTKHVLQLHNCIYTSYAFFYALKGGGGASLNAYKKA